MDIRWKKDNALLLLTMACAAPLYAIISPGGRHNNIADCWQPATCSRIPYLRKPYRTTRSWFEVAFCRHICYSAPTELLQYSVSTAGHHCNHESHHHIQSLLLPEV
jgi:hypothetical protein